MLSLFNIGEVLQELKRWNDSISPLRKARELFSQLGDFQSALEAQSLIINAHEKLGDFKEAKAQTDWSREYKRHTEMGLDSPD